MTRVALQNVPDNLSELMQKVRAGERVVISEGKAQLAALVPPEDLKLLKQFQEMAEDWADMQAYRRAKKSRVKALPFDAFCRQLNA